MPLPRLPARLALHRSGSSGCDAYVEKPLLKRWKMLVPPAKLCWKVERSCRLVPNSVARPQTIMLPNDFIRSGKFGKITMVGNVLER
ncbi:MAG: hypothetical protein ACLR6J_07660 [Parabacteroides merdae]